MSQNKMLALVVVVGSILGAQAFAQVIALTAEPSREARVQAAAKCGAKLGAGGNLVEGGQRLAGKCQGDGRPVEIVGTRSRKALKFSTDPEIQPINVTRAELAVTQEAFPFKQKLYIGFRMMIPEGSDDTDGFFSLLQLWQCSPRSPIAGIRVNRGQGNSHTINFMTRGDFREGRFATYNLNPGTWHSFVVMYDVNPRKGEGTATLWADGSGPLVTAHESFGYFSADACPGIAGRPPQNFRVKFGIYKNAEPGRKFEVQYDDFKIGTSYKSVVPW